MEIEISQLLYDILSVEIEHVSKTTAIIPFLVGEPGIGKSSIVKYLCWQKGWLFFELLCNQLGEKNDITGCRTVKNTIDINGQTEEVWQQVFFPHQAIQNAITAAKNNPQKTVVLFMDEINRTGSDVTSAILSFTTARTIGTVMFPDNIRFIVAGNDTGNVVALDSASISRFAKFRIKPSAKTFMQIESKLNPYIRQVLTDNPQYIFCKDESVMTPDDDEQQEYNPFDEAETAFSQLTTPRTISGLNAFLNACSPKKLTQYLSTIERDTETREEISMLQVIIEAHIGHTAFAAALCGVIANSISNGMIQNATVIETPSRPDIYDDILRCTDRTTRDNMLNQMSDDDKSAVILYAVWESSDNTDLITSIANNFNGNMLTQPYMVNFAKLKSNDMLNQDNYTALIQSQTPLATMIYNTLGE